MIDTMGWWRYALAVAGARALLEDVCACGDVLDEHEAGGGPCTVCPCVHFEAAGS